MSLTLTKQLLAPACAGLSRKMHAANAAMGVVAAHQQRQTPLLAPLQAPGGSAAGAQPRSAVVQARVRSLLHEREKQLQQQAAERERQLQVRCAALGWAGQVVAVGSGGESHTGKAS